MSERIAGYFSGARASGRGALLPYVTAGYPDIDTTIAILRDVHHPAVACVELGIPFSDPIADGPIIQTSFSRALRGGFRLNALFERLCAQRDSIRVPLVAMVSYTIVFRRGVAAFVTAAVSAGIEALIIPDLPLEEADDVREVAGAAGCGLILIVAPTSSTDRRRRIATVSSPFLYYQSVAGVTGERTALPPELAMNVQQLREMGGKPVCVGFGISQAAHVREVCSVADGAIVGSAIVRRMNDAVDRGESSTEVAAIALRTIEELAAGV